jgi:hypothetical protein
VRRRVLTLNSKKHSEDTVEHQLGLYASGQYAEGG